MDHIAGHALPNLAGGCPFQINSVAALELTWRAIDSANSKKLVEEIRSLAIESAASAETLQAFLDAACGR
jgi:hypothetical protein